MFKRQVGIAVLLAVAAFSASAKAAVVHMDFSASDAGTNVNGAFQINDSIMGPPAFSNRFQLGSDAPNNGDSLNFLRITSATVNGGSVGDVISLIVVLPEFIISDTGNGALGEFGLAFNNGLGGATTNIAGGFKIYGVLDTGLVTPLLTSDIKLVDPLITIGGSGIAEATPGVIGLSNMVLSPGGAAISTLVQFAANGAADFNAQVTTTSTDIGAAILAGQTIFGSASGSLESIPEPGTMTLLAAGALLAMRRRRQAK